MPFNEDILQLADLKQRI